MYAHHSYMTIISSSRINIQERQSLDLGPNLTVQWQCFDLGSNLYREVGTSPPDVRFFTLSNVVDKNQTNVRIHSVNGSFPDTIATVHEVGGGTPGKIAWRAMLFNGQLYRGIMRANSAGGEACCEQKMNKTTGKMYFADCPVVSWWAADGSSSCWAPVNVPSAYTGSCTE